MAIWHQRGQVLTLVRHHFTPGHSKLLQFIFPSFFQLLKFFSPFTFLLKCTPVSSQPSNNVFSKGAAKNANTNEICAAASVELGPLHIVLSDIKNKQTKNTNLQEWAILFLSSLKKLWECKTKAANSNELHRTPHPCVLLPREQDENATSDPHEILHLICKPVTMTAHANWSDKSQSEE